MESKFSRLAGYAFVAAGCLLLAAMSRLELLLIVVPAASALAVGLARRSAKRRA